MPQHAMVDCETLDTLPSAIVLSMGAVKFDPFSFKEPLDSLHIKIDIDEQISRGRTQSESTLKWWSEQDNKVIEDVFKLEGRLSVVDTLKRLKKWFVAVDYIWAQGTTFDIAILEDLCRMYGRPIPWSYHQIMDSKTVFRFLDEDPRKSFKFTKHNPLEDAFFQAKGVQMAYKELTPKRFKG